MCVLFRSSLCSGEFQRVIAPMWLHSGFLHLAMNLVSLFTLRDLPLVSFSHCDVRIVIWRLGVGFEQLYGTLRGLTVDV